MEYIELTLSIIACVVSIIVLVFVIKDKKKGDITLGDDNLKKIKESVNDSINTLSVSVSNLVAEKNNTLMDKLNKEIEDLNKKVDNLTLSYNKFSEETFKTLSGFIQKYTEDNSKQKEEMLNSIATEMKKTSETIKEKLEEFKNSTKDSIKDLSESVSKSLSDIRKDNSEKLDKINESVNEKLQKTLSENLEKSFKSVVEGIGDVNKAVGEIKGLATDVGSLKNVLTNVKTKGILGEVILGNIIKEFLTVNQYVENYPTKVGSTERVEFAIKLPGTRDETIYLPVDSKFPYEAYSIIQKSTDKDEIEAARKELRSNLLKYAKDVSEKYIDVPNTTDFAVIFLPLEGLYLEALNMGLFEEIQTKYKVNLTGPTTFTAFINSLNMGFRSLMIQKKSADVFKLLGAVKTEFGKFAEALEKTQKKVNQAAEDLDSLVGTRTKQLNRALKDIDTIDDEESKLLIDDNDGNK